MKLPNIRHRLADAIEGKKRPELDERGATGTVFFAGMLASEEEYNPDLKGIKGLETMDKMRRGDGQVKASLLACTLPLLVANWDIEPASSSPKDVEIADSLRHNLFEDMSITWDNFLRQALLCLPFGFMVFEKVWKMQGGKYLWRKLAPRLPRTIVEWHTDPNGGLDWIKQRTWKDEKYTDIPLEVKKILVFTNEMEGGNFTGMSILRAAYKPWYFKSQLEKIDGIAAEIHGLGMPYFKYPGNASAADKAKIEKIGERLHAHERRFIALPDSMTFSLEGVRGQLHNVVKSMEYHDNQIARSVLNQFINLGQAGMGSYSLSADMSSFFLMALKATANNITGIMNRHAIRQWVNFNYVVDVYPKLMVSGLEYFDIGAYSKAVKDMVDGDLIEPDEDIEQELRRRLHLPPRKTPWPDPKPEPEPVPEPQSVEPEPEPEPEDKAQNFNQPEPAVKLVYWQPRRPLRGMETCVAFNEINGELDGAEDKLISAAKAVQDRQIANIAAKVIHNIREGDLERIPIIDIPYREEMAAVIESVLLDLYEYGQEQVKREIAVQRDGLKAQEQIFEPLSVSSEAATRQYIRTRSKATANVLASKLRGTMAWEALRQARSGLLDESALVNTLTGLSDKELTNTAKFSVSESFNLGRNNQAQDMQDEIDHVEYSALMDDNTCPPCALLDGQSFEFPSAAWDEVTPPLKACEGKDRCRCLGVYVLKSEAPQIELQPEPLVPDMPPVVYMEGVTQARRDLANEYVARAPVKARKGIRQITLDPEKGPVGKFDHETFRVGANYDPRTQHINIFDANKLGRDELAKDLGHEIGHNGWRELELKTVTKFVSSTDAEGGITPYAREWLRSGLMSGVDENFAEWNALLVLRDKRLLGLAKNDFPRQWSVMQECWEELGGEIWW